MGVPSRGVGDAAPYGYAIIGPGFHARPRRRNRRGDFILSRNAGDREGRPYESVGRDGFVINFIRVNPF